MDNTPENYEPRHRPNWDEYFLMLAKLAATRSTCLAFPVGAVIVKNRQILATGYNGSPSGSAHCTTQGFCYPGLSSCDASKILPSRAVHAEANAIAKSRKTRHIYCWGEYLRHLRTLHLLFEISDCGWDSGNIL